jgi:hypothetical protein
MRLSFNSKNKSSSDTNDHERLSSKRIMLILTVVILTGVLFLTVIESQSSVSADDGSEINTHKVFYMVYDGSNPPPVQEDVAEGETFVVASYNGKKGGGAFMFWLDDEGVYFPGREYTMGENDVVLRAYFEEPTKSSTPGILIIIIVLLITVTVVYYGLQRRANKG